MYKYKQLKRAHTITFKSPEILNQQNLNLWLEMLEIPLESNDNDDITIFNNILINLMDTLFYATKIPIFEKSIIKKIIYNEKNNTYTLKIFIPYIQNYSHKIFNDYLNYTVKLIFWIIQSEFTEDNKNIFFKSCIDELINPTAAKMPLGISTYYILRAAFKNNISFFHLGGGIYQLGQGANLRKIDRSSVDKDSAIGVKIANNKLLTSNILNSAGIPSSKHFITNTFEQALKVATKIGYPLVIKPLDMERAEGVSINIYDEKKLFEAFNYAKKTTKKNEVLIEKQVPGVCHRIHIVDSKLLYVMKRMPISIEGNGKDTISQIIFNRNKEIEENLPWNRKDYYPLDEMAIKIIEEHGYSIQTILNEGEWLPLREFEATRFGARVEDLSDEIHPENLNIAIKAAKLLNLTTAGVDMITDDISKPWYETNAIINEINYAPMFASNEIYQKNMNKFFNIFLNNNGQIPIYIFVGEGKESYNKALTKQKELTSKNSKSYIVSNKSILNEKNENVILRVTSLTKKIEALLNKKEVQSLIIVIEDNEVLLNPPFLPHITDILLCKETIKDLKSNKSILISQDKINKIFNKEFI